MTEHQLATQLTVGEDLIARCQAGDHRAFDELVRRHRSHVTRLVRRMTCSSTDTEDIVQEVFIQVFRSIQNFRGNAQFHTWLYRVTLNVVLMQRRALKSRPALVLIDHIAAASDPLPDALADQAERLKLLLNLLERLSPKKRDVYVLHDLQGVSASEISRRTGIPTLTVRTRLFYARHELCQMLDRQAA